VYFILSFDFLFLFFFWLIYLFLSFALLSIFVTFSNKSSWLKETNTQHDYFTLTCLCGFSRFFSRNEQAFFSAEMPVVILIRNLGLPFVTSLLGEKCKNPGRRFALATGYPPPPWKVSLTVRLSIIPVINQLNAQNLVL